MLKIVEKVFSNHPIRLPVMPGVKLIAGYVGTLIDYNGILVCDMCKVGQFPFGIIGQTKYVKELSFDKKNMISIWHQRMIFKTDNFEHSNYEPGDKLYVGESGMLTNEPVSDTDMFVARLTGFPDDRHSFYEALWI